MESMYRTDRETILRLKCVDVALTALGLPFMTQAMILSGLGIAVAILIRKAFQRGLMTFVLQIPAFIVWIVLLVPVTLVFVWIHDQLDPDRHRRKKLYPYGHAAWASVVIALVYISVGLLVRDTEMGWPIFFQGVVFVLPLSYLIFVSRTDTLPPQHQEEASELSAAGQMMESSC